jgi:2'-5' RNA ligase
MESHKEQQHKLFEQLETQFKEGDKMAEIFKPALEHVSDYISDNRICLTSVVFPSEEIIKVIEEKIVSQFFGVDENQYFLLPESFHLTIQNVRTIHNPPLFTDDDIRKAKEVFKKVVPKHHKLSISLKGLFEAPTSFVIRCYCDDNLQKLVLDLRSEMIAAGIPDNKKYASGNIILGGITVCRYTKKPNDKFCETIKKLKNIEIGNLLVDKISLITTNSVAHPNKTKIIEEYYLGNG